MAYPASTVILAETLATADKRIVQFKATLQAANSYLAGNNAGADFILNVYRRLRKEHAELTALAAVSGIGAYAQEQKADQNLDVAAEFNTLLGIIDTAADWIVANMPTVDVNGTDYLVLLTLAAEADDVTWRTFTPAQTATLRTNLTAIINGIS